MIQARHQARRCRNRSKCRDQSSQPGEADVRLNQQSKSCGGRTRTCTRLLNREPPYRLATPQSQSESGRPELNQRSRALSFHSSSAQRESNPHFRHGKAVGCRYITGAFGQCGTSGSCGSRTRPLRCERAGSLPIDERADAFTKSTHPKSANIQWAGRRSNPRLLVFSQALHRLSYQPNKKTRCRRHRVFLEEAIFKTKAECQHRRRSKGRSFAG